MADDSEKNTDAQCWQIGQWLYWPESGQLKNGQKKDRLSNQLNQVLHLLIQDAPHVVTRQKFLDKIWTDKFVNEDALSRTIAELRKILGDSASQAKYIKTIPKQGYQLTISVEPVKEKLKRRGYVAMFALVLIALAFVLWKTPKNAALKQLQESVAAAERFTAKPGMEQQSNLSADGQWLTYVQNNSRGSFVTLQSIVDDNQSHVVELARHLLSSPVYLSEQKKLIVTARDQSQCYLKTYNMATRLFKDLADCDFQSESRTTAWHEKDELVLFSAPINASNKAIAIHQVSLDGVHKKQITRPDNSLDWSPQVSPDSKWLSFSRGNHSVRNIWIKPWPEGEAIAITTGAHYSVSHSWFDADHIVFDSDMNGSRQLWLVNIYDKQPQLIGAYGAQHPTFDLNKTMMVYQEVSYEANIWRYEIKTESHNRVIHSTKYDNNPAFSPNGSQMLYSSNRQDKGSIWQYDFNSNKDQLLLSLPDSKLTRPFWHNDGVHVLVTANADDGFSTIKYNLNTKQHQRLPFGEPNISAQANGDNYYALSKSAENNNKIIKLINGQTEVLPIDAVSRFVLMNDQKLAYSKVNQNGLFVFDLRTFQEFNVLPRYRKHAMNLWSAVNQSIYYDQPGEQAGIWRIDINSREKEFITEHRPFSVGTSLSVNADETELLITQTDRAESDIFKALLK